jgi:HSP20 family molecular chaperone IbpA
MSMIYRHHHPAFSYHRRPSSAHPFLGLFLKNLFFLATAFVAGSIATRMVILTLSILFSPSVFVLLLLTFATSWWRIDALRHERSPFPTSTAFGGRSCQQQSSCSPSSRRADRQRRREFCHRFQQQCQSQRQQQEQSCQKRDNETKPSSTCTAEDSKSEESSSNNIRSKERLNKNFQSRRVFYYQRTPFHIEQDDQHATLSIDVPGYSVGDINITVDQDGTALAIAGERKNKIGNAFAFQRQFVLNPNIMDTTSITANVVDGLLSIIIAKKEIPKPRLITITTTEAQETDRDDTGAEGSSEDQHVTLSIDVPGYSVSDINITVDQDGTLAIAGERKNKIGNAFAFQRHFVLNPTTMDTTSITANVVDGLLSITIAKKEIPKPRLITITTTEAQETDRRDDTEGPSEEEVEEETRIVSGIVFEKAPVEEEEDLLAANKPIGVETVNEDETANVDEDVNEDEDEEDQVEEGDHDSWEDVIKA